MTSDPPARLPPDRDRRLREFCALLRRQGYDEIADYIDVILYAPIVPWADR
jgi:hypothetical protein